MQLYAATTNAGKLRDFAQSAASEGIEVVPLPGLASLPEPAEDAADFLGNAQLKAIAYSRLAPGLLILADDSGLEVAALGGEPGVRSARFADDLHFTPPAETGLGSRPPLTKDQRNNLCLLSRLHAAEAATSPAPGTARQARFVCALAVAHDGRVLHQALGSVQGEILDTPRGSNGFGYDPLFYLPSLGSTMGELDPATKWSHGHRGEAFRVLLRILSAPLGVTSQNRTM